MTAFDRADDPIEGARAAIASGTSVRAVCRTFGPAAHRAHRIAALRSLLSEQDAEAADRAVGRLLSALEREAAA